MIWLLFFKPSDGFLEAIRKLEAIAKTGCDLVEMATPTNVREEKERWLEAAEMEYFSYFPQFSYNEELLIKNCQMKGKIESVNWDLLLRGTCDFERSIFINRKNNLLLTSEIGENLMTADFVKACQNAKQKFGEVDFFALNHAKKQLLNLWLGTGNEACGKAKLGKEQIRHLEECQFDAEGIAYWFKWAIDEYGLDFKVEISDSATAIDVRDRAVGGPKIVIPKDRVVSGRKLITLVRHEIECHARDSVNGATLFSGLGGGFLRCDDDVLYEGHAMWEEKQLELELFGSCKKPLPWYTLSLNLLDQDTFFEDIAQYIFLARLAIVRLTEKDEKKAQKKALDLTWTTMYRSVFRVIGQKDKAYLEGFLYAQNLASIGRSHWLSVGTVSIDELEATKRLCPDFKASDLPIPDRNLAKKLAYELLMS